MEMIYDRIAEILTRIRIEAGQLPHPISGSSGYRGDYDYYRFIKYRPDLKSFFFAVWVGEEDLTSYINYSFASPDPIDMKAGIREAWTHLNREEQNELMSEVLGNHGNDI